MLTPNITTGCLAQLTQKHFSRSLRGSVYTSGIEAQLPLSKRACILALQLNDASLVLATAYVDFSSSVQGRVTSITQWQGSAGDPAVLFHAELSSN